MKIVRKFVWLLLTIGLIALTVQTASPIALGIAACMVLLPLAVAGNVIADLEHLRQVIAGPLVGIILGIVDVRRSGG